MDSREVFEVAAEGEKICPRSDKCVKVPECKLQEPDSLDFLSGKRSHDSKGSPEEVAHNPDLSTEALPMQKDESATSSENLDAEPIDDTKDVETSQVSEVAQEEANTAEEQTSHLGLSQVTEASKVQIGKR
ncbi:TFIIS N-terminal domain-containing protein [Forsythia ovata]|uniref:TFIIS N-terminal domain-containing protein n=1 Tax=Forsythia ovata TaxID=205694 RepID=A0ABD1U6G4_9LAMI